MLVWIGLLLTALAQFRGLGVQAGAQVLVTNRGEPAPFPHFPSVTAAPASSEVPQDEPQFQFAPTPTGRALPVNELPDVPQALGSSNSLTFSTAFLLASNCAMGESCPYRGLWA